MMLYSTGVKEDLSVQPVPPITNDTDVTTKTTTSVFASSQQTNTNTTTSKEQQQQVVGDVQKIVSDIQHRFDRWWMYHDQYDRQQQEQKRTIDDIVDPVDSHNKNHPILDKNDHINNNNDENDEKNDSNKTIDQMIQSYWIPFLRQQKEQSGDRIMLMIRTLLQSKLLLAPQEIEHKYYTTIISTSNHTHTQVAPTELSTAKKKKKNKKSTRKMDRRAWIQSLLYNETNKNISDTSDTKNILIDTNASIEMIDDCQLNNNTNNILPQLQQQQGQSSTIRCQIQFQIVLRWTLLLEFLSCYNATGTLNNNDNIDYTKTMLLREYATYFERCCKRSEGKSSNKKISKMIQLNSKQKQQNVQEQKYPLILQHFKEYIQLLAVHLVPQDISLYHHLRTQLLLFDTTCDNSNNNKRNSHNNASLIQFVQPIWEDLEIQNPLLFHDDDDDDDKHDENNSSGVASTTTTTIELNKMKQKATKKRRRKEETSIGSTNSITMQQQQQHILDQILPDTKANVRRPSILLKQKQKPMNRLICDKVQLLNSSYHVKKNSRYSNLSTILQQQIPVAIPVGTKGIAGKQKQQQQQSVSTKFNSNNKKIKITQSITKENAVPKPAASIPSNKNAMSLSSSSSNHIVTVKNKNERPTTKSIMPTKNVVAEAMYALQQRQLRRTGSVD